ncbi:hypothetical protein AHAS_Ahas03G0209100 [Arachis hypogaea]
MLNFILNMSTFWGMLQKTPTMIHMPRPLIRDGEITQILDGESNLRGHIILIILRQATSQPQKTTDLESLVASFVQETRASLKNLEVHMRQIATKVVEIDQRTTKEEVSKNKKVPRGWRNKKIPTEDFSPGMKVVFTASPVLPHTVNRILPLEHVELIHESSGKKFIVKGEELSPYDHPPP